MDCKTIEKGYVMSKNNSPKYILGEKVYFIRNGYILDGEVTSIFKNKNGEYIYKIQRCIILDILHFSSRNYLFHEKDIYSNKDEAEKSFSKNALIRVLYPNKEIY